jgi:hypothetical protein
VKFYERDRYARAFEELSGEKPVCAVVLRGRTSYRVPRHLVRTESRLLLVLPKFFGGPRKVVDSLQPSEVTVAESGRWSVAKLFIGGRRWYVQAGYNTKETERDLRRTLTLPAPPTGAKS